VASWKPSCELVLRKNEHYWNKDRIKIDEVHFLVLDPGTALNMFEKGELDWAGSPMATLPPDAIAALKAQKKLQICDAAGTQFIRANCERAPLTSKKLRQALSAVIDRALICEYVMQGGHMPSKLLVPPFMGLGGSQEPLLDPKATLDEACQELTMTKEEISKALSLSFPAKERTQKIATVIQQNWKEHLGLDIGLAPCEGKIFFEKLAKKDYCLALGSWIADVADPIDFLAVFQSKENGTNNTGWEDNRYQELLRASAIEQNPHARLELLRQAQDILIDEAPIFPIFHFTYNFLQSTRLRGCPVTPSGMIALRDAYIFDAPS
jgi:oligopeptide transport system substrate-binding protein